MISRCRRRSAPPTVYSCPQVFGESLALSMIAVMLSVPLAVWSAKGLTVLLWNQPDVFVTPGREPRLSCVLA